MFFMAFNNMNVIDGSPSTFQLKSLKTLEETESDLWLFLIVICHMLCPLIPRPVHYSKTQMPPDLIGINWHQVKSSHVL